MATLFSLPASRDLDTPTLVFALLQFRVLGLCAQYWQKSVRSILDSRDLCRRIKTLLRERSGQPAECHYLPGLTALEQPCATWFSLSNFNGKPLGIGHEELVGVTGSGESSFLQAVLGKIHMARGNASLGRLLRGLV